MPTLEWSDALALDLPQMDATHLEFVSLLAVVDAASDGALIPAWQQLVEHTAAHFAQEDRWMADTGFAPDNCHTARHKVVLDIIKMGAVKGAQGDLAMVRQMARELADWFPSHAQAMDGALVDHLRKVGYDTVSATVCAPTALPQTAIHGCGSADMCISEQHQATGA